MPTVERLGNIRTLLLRASQQAGKRLGIGRLAALPYDQAHPPEVRQAARELTLITVEQIKLEQLDPVSVADQAIEELTVLRDQLDSAKAQIKQLERQVEQHEQYWDNFDPQVVNSFRQMMQAVINDLRHDPQLLPAEREEAIRNVMLTAYVAVKNALEGRQPVDSSGILAAIDNFFDLSGLSPERVTELLRHRERLNLVATEQVAQIDQLLTRFIPLEPALRDRLLSELAKSWIPAEDILSMKIDDQYVMLTQPLNSDVRKAVLGQLVLDHIDDTLKTLFDTDPAVQAGGRIVMTEWLRAKLHYSAGQKEGWQAFKKELSTFDSRELAAIRELLQERILKNADEKEDITRMGTQLLGTIKKSLFGNWQVS
jgi:hypothetical protein